MIGSVGIKAMTPVQTIKMGVCSYCNLIPGATADTISILPCISAALAWRLAGRDVTLTSVLYY